MLFKILKREILQGHTQDFPDKLDIFYAAGKLTTEEYNVLLQLYEEHKG